MKIKVVITTLICIFIFQFGALADSFQQTKGAYYQIGKYNGNPIIWRCIETNDENGILMVSDKILCFKSANAGEKLLAYGDGLWESSTIRTWLNSTADATKVSWTSYPPDFEHLNIEPGHRIYSPYADEQGFLNSNNFTDSEKSVIKTVSQWHALPTNKLEQATNGHSEPYITVYTISYPRGESKLEGRIKLSELKDSYKGAMYRINDSVFLLNEPQLYSVYEQLGTVGAMPVSVPELGVGKIKEVVHSDDEYDYWLRSPGNPHDTAFNYIFADKNVLKAHSCVELGIRPAFYLNEDNVIIKSGSGTENDPYILDGVAQEGITVFSNGEQIEFAQQPVLENDRTLVGMRAVFESLDANVKWDGETKTVIAAKGDTEIELQIDNDTMIVNDNAIELDTPARLINDTTMVPLRAVSEALDAKVEWIGDLQRIVIDVQPEWKESDWAPDWYVKAMKAGGYF